MVGSFVRGAANIGQSVEEVGERPVTTHVRHRRSENTVQLTFLRLTSLKDRWVGYPRMACDSAGNGICLFGTGCKFPQTACAFFAVNLARAGQQ